MTHGHKNQGITPSYKLLRREKNNKYRCLMNLWFVCGHCTLIAVAEKFDTFLMLCKVRYIACTDNQNAQCFTGDFFVPASYRIVDQMSMSLHQYGTCIYINSRGAIK